MAQRLEARWHPQGASKGPAHAAVLWGGQAKPGLLSVSLGVDA